MRAIGLAEKSSAYKKNELPLLENSSRLDAWRRPKTLIPYSKLEALSPKSSSASFLPRPHLSINTATENGL
jgi:hypothetical protein